MKTIRTEIASEKNNFNYVEALLLKVNKEFKLPESELHKVLIAVSEIVMNAIVHGNKENKFKKVEVIVEYNNEKMCVKICDEGNGFNINDDIDPTLDENIMKSSGRGMFIAKSLVKDIRYKHTQKGSEVILTIHR
ncbi:MAG: ATP-binding protein [Ignavibacteriae bacterium]|nr:MAG: ATP-binding protein [Ignavibacteriota bacterium]